MPYMAAYVLYCALGMVLYIAVVTDGERRWDHIALLALAPAVTLNIWTGQNGFLTTALLIGGLTQLDRRPIFAGVLFGVLSVKPQLGILLPVMLALTGRWRVIAAAAATIAILIAVTCIAFGAKVWTDYLDLAMPLHARSVTEGSGFFVANMPTAFMNLRLIGAPASVTYAVQAAISAATLAAVVWVFWRPRDPVLSLCFFVSAAFLFTPYAFNYDMVAFGWVMLRLMERSDNEPVDYALMLAVWVTPICHHPAGPCVACPARSCRSSPSPGGCSGAFAPSRSPAPPCRPVRCLPAPVKTLPRHSISSRPVLQPQRPLLYEPLNAAGGRRSQLMGIGPGAVLRVLRPV